MAPDIEEQLRPSEEDLPALGRVVRDVVHDYVIIPPEINALIDHPFVQRLRRVGQTSMTDVVFPGMSHNRFEHALGTMHLARTFWETAWLNTPPKVREEFAAALFESCENIYSSSSALPDNAYTTFIKDPSPPKAERFASAAVTACGLLHDVGQPPFSHALESFFLANLTLKDILTTEQLQLVDAQLEQQPQSHFHDVAGRFLLEYIDFETVRELPWAYIKHLLTAKLPEGSLEHALDSLISGRVDVKRIDYILRDAKHSGTEFGAIDHTRLMHSMELHVDERGWALGFDERATSAIESLLHARYQYYRWVLLHSHSVAANRMLAWAVDDLMILQREWKDRGIEPVSRRNLNYFLDVAGSTNSAERQRLASVDDVTIIEWLKEGLAQAHREQPTGLVKSFTALAQATIWRTPNWAPAWKTGVDYTDLAGELMEPLREALVRALEELKNETGPSAIATFRKLADIVRRRKVADLTTRRKLLDDMLHILDHEDPPRYLNSISSLLFGNRQKAMALWHERHLSGLMTGLTRENFSGTLPDGFWLLAYSPMETFVNIIHTLPIFSGNNRVNIRADLMINLEYVEQTRVQLHAIYVSTEAERMRIGRQSLYGPSLRECFLTLFPELVYRNLMKHFQTG
jgi:HD superfamily phosphohydrolase